MMSEITVKVVVNLSPEQWKESDYDSDIFDSCENETDRYTAMLKSDFDEFPDSIMETIAQGAESVDIKDVKWF